MAAGAQTEVRRAIALPSYKDLKYPPLPPLKVPDPSRDHALEWHESAAAGGSRAAADQRRGFDPHRQSCSIRPTSAGWPA